jgi:hypothetical protein
LTANYGVDSIAGMNKDRPRKSFLKTLMGLQELIDELDIKLTASEITPVQAVTRLEYETLRTIAFSGDVVSKRDLKTMAKMAHDFRIHVVEKHEGQS